jgi:thioredoxin reductase (NADPH)
MHDIIIVGGGPAGLTAAIYGLRAGESVLVIEKAGFGGQIAFSPKVENIPGTASISGSEFADKLTEQTMNLGADVELEILVPEAQAQPFLDKLTDLSAATIEGMETDKE